MAEGGIAAAVGNVDPEDSRRQHFIDTHVATGMFINNWQMAEIFTKEAPRRVTELRAVGRALQPD